MIETWLMSCRVLGRKVEEACLNVLAEACAARGMKRLIGAYRPTEKNGMVREMYGTLGFDRIETDEAGATRWRLSLQDFHLRPVPIEVNVPHEAVA
jgi:predicted enzyme involved in methoxymalonyl-ACP biosynthesis